MRLWGGADPAARAGAVSPGDIVIYTADPLLFGGELLVIGCGPDGRLLCEAVHYEQESENDAPPRALLHPHEVELAHRWASA